MKKILLLLGFLNTFFLFAGIVPLQKFDTNTLSHFNDNPLYQALSTNDKFLYVLESTGDISTYAVDTNGILTFIHTSDLNLNIANLKDETNALLISSNGSDLYFTDALEQIIHLKIDNTTQNITIENTYTLNNNGSPLLNVTLDNNTNRLYAIQKRLVSYFQIQADGTLTLEQQLSLSNTRDQFLNITTDNNGFLYVLSSDTLKGAIYTFRIDNVSGNLTLTDEIEEANGSLGHLKDITIHNNHIYIAKRPIIGPFNVVFDRGGILVFDIDTTTGSLNLIQKEQTQLGTNFTYGFFADFLKEVVVSNDGKELYVVDYGVSVFTSEFRNKIISYSINPDGTIAFTGNFLSHDDTQVAVIDNAYQLTPFHQSNNFFSLSTDDHSITLLGQVDTPEISLVDQDQRFTLAESGINIPDIPIRIKNHQNISVFSSDGTIIDAQNISVNHIQGDNFNVSFTELPNTIGSTVITIQAEGINNSKSLARIHLRVLPENNLPPTLNVMDITIKRGERYSASNPILANFVSDADTPFDILSTTITSSNPTLIPSDALLRTGIIQLYSNVLYINTPINQLGSSLITVTLNDSKHTVTKTFRITVVEPSTLFSDNDFTHFYTGDLRNNPDSWASIDTNNHKVELVLPENSAINLTSVSPFLGVSIGASVIPSNLVRQDFSNGPIIYEVTAENGDIQEWEVTVRKENVLSVEDHKVLNFSLYPNPANTVINLGFSAPIEGNLAIYDISGRIVKQQELNANNATATIDIINLSSGMYMIEIVSNTQERLIKKFYIL